MIAVLAVAGGGMWWSRHQRHRHEEAIESLLTRWSGWQRTSDLCGYGPHDMADRTAVTPRGDRRFGFEHLLSGPLTVGTGSRHVTTTASCGYWWYEVRSTSNSNGRSRTTYDRQTNPIVAVTLPGPVPSAVSIVPESMFGRIGLTRGGEQLESDGFNRRFRVEGDDRTLTVQLLDAQLQQHLLERYQSRQIELADDLFLLGGRPTERDDTLYGAVRELPGLLDDADDLLRHVPLQFWRALGLETSAPDPTSPADVGPPQGAAIPPTPQPPMPQPPTSGAPPGPPAPPTPPTPTSPVGPPPAP